MATFAFSTAVGAALAAAAIALAGPALASADDGTATSSRQSSTSSTAGSRNTDTAPEESAQGAAAYTALRDAIRSGAINSGAPIAGLDQPAGDPADFTFPSDLP